MITKNSRASNRPSYGLFKLKNLPFMKELVQLRDYKIINRKLITPEVLLEPPKKQLFNWLKDFLYDGNAIFNLGSELQRNLEYFCRTLFTKFANWYVPINFNNLIDVGNHGDSQGNYIGRLDTDGLSLYHLKLRNGFFTLNGIPLNDASGQGKLKTIESISLKVPLDFSPSEAIVYVDSIGTLQEIAQISVDLFEQLKKLYNAYTAIPVANEQFTDETIVTPNLSTETRDGFNPISAVSENISDRTKTTQTGTSTSVTKRATGHTAKEQADIVRNIPNLFTQTMSRIASALISPQAVQDMLEFGLCNYDYIDYD